MNRNDINNAGLHTALRGRVEPFRAMEIVARAGTLAAQGRDVISMCVGQPFAPAPASARKAAIKAVEAGRIGYTASPGIPDLRKRIAGYYAEHYGVSVDPVRIIVTTGSSAGFMLAFIACFNPGENVAIPSPGYPAYRNILKALSLEPVQIETRREDRRIITPYSLLERHKQNALAGILVANPNNPNGTMMSARAFEELNMHCRDQGIRFISDEIYHGLTYGMPETTALAIDDDAIVINSFSKFFCMTGWRIGWMIVPENLVSTIERLQQNAFICAPEVSQIAALAAFEGLDDLRQVRDGYAENRQRMLQRLPELGISEIQPIDGAFYAYCNVANLTHDSTDFAARLLEETSVAITPGLDFDPVHGDEWIRLSFCGNAESIDSAFDRIGNWLPKITGSSPKP
jgi:aspartate/methionine/tyrosine aminotransferase